MCVDANFAGGCQILGPGRYADLGELSGRVSSARPVATRYSNNPNDPRYGNDGRNPNDGRNRGRNASVTLYEGPNLSGRSFALNDTMRNLDGTGFNDRASSVHVDSGYWIFCSDAEFRGDCRTFGPGDYATLPPGLNNVISSGRRISNDYPYGERPDWQRSNR
ncbi:MAG: beta/gamma crystallin family protein [Aromatoleum sp.]|nr:beta/gamma crystallin family protein [Aromatoleum sp.]